MAYGDIIEYAAGLLGRRSAVVDDTGQQMGTVANPFQVDTGVVSTLGLGAVITPTITVSITPAYSPGDVIGGEIVLTGALRTGTANGFLQNLLLIDDANQKPPLVILLFNADPAATYTDNAACPDLSTDIDKLIGMVTIAAADWKTVGTVGICDKATPLSKMLQAGATNGDLRMVIVADPDQANTPDFVATTDLRIRLGFAWN